MCDNRNNQIGGKNMNPKNSIEEKTMTFSESISEILYYYDVAGLVRGSVPEDEYISEARAIVYRLREVDDIRSLKWLVYEVFEAFLFKESILPLSNERYLFIAEEIWELWQENIEAQEMKYSTK
jgi:hypothetical protein